MDPRELLKPLLDRAFDRASATDANQAIARVRDRAVGKEPRSYEVVAEEEKTLEELAEAVMPRLVYHLESLGAHLPECGDVFVSLFVGAELYFIHAREAVEVLGGAMGLLPDELVARYGTDELRRALHPSEAPARRSPLLLSPPKGER